MLSRAYRLHKNRDIIKVLQKGVRINGSGIRLIYCPNSRNAHLRATVIISNKVAKNASTRNKVKRIVRAELHQLVKEHSELKQDLVISILQAGSPDILHKSCQDLFAKFLSNI